MTGALAPDSYLVNIILENIFFFFQLSWSVSLCEVFTSSPIFHMGRWGSHEFYKYSLKWWRHWVKRLNLRFQKSFVSTGQENNLRCCDLSSTWHFVNLSFCRLVILSSCHFVNLSFCRLVILLTCHFVDLSFCRLVIFSTFHYVNLTFHQLVILSTCHFLNLSFCQPAILSTCNFISLQFHQLAIS